MTTRQSRDEILARARAATANDPPQVVGYSELELERARRWQALRAHLLEMQRTRSPEALALGAQRAVRAGGERAPILPPVPEPADDAPQTKLSAGCGLEPPPDTHRPFPLVRVLRPGVPHWHALPTPPGNAPPPPTEPRQRASEPPEPTRLARRGVRSLWRLLGQRWAAGGGW